MTTVAVVSDTHLPRGARRLPEACLEQLRGADLILHGGDFTGASVLEELRAALPAERVVEAGGARIGIVHDGGLRAGREARLAARFPRCHVVVYGHTHVPQVERFGEVWVLNPGSPTERRSAPRRSLLVLEIEAGEIRPQLVTV